MKIKLGDLIESNHSHPSDVGVVVSIKKERRSPTMIRIFWQKSKVTSPWLRPGLFKRVRQEQNPDGGRAP